MEMAVGTSNKVMRLQVIPHAAPTAWDPMACCGILGSGCKVHVYLGLAPTASACRKAGCRPAACLRHPARSAPGPAEAQTCAHAHLGAARTGSGSSKKARQQQAGQPLTQHTCLHASHVCKMLKHALPRACCSSSTLLMFGAQKQWGVGLSVCLSLSGFRLPHRPPSSCLSALASFPSHPPPPPKEHSPPGLTRFASRAFCSSSTLLAATSHVRHQLLPSARRQPGMLLHTAAIWLCQPLKTIWKHRTNTCGGKGFWGGGGGLTSGQTHGRHKCTSLWEEKSAGLRTFGATRQRYFGQQRTVEYQTGS